MKTKHVLLISAGVLAAAGIAFALTRKKDEKKSGFQGTQMGSGDRCECRPTGGKCPKGCKLNGQSQGFSVAATTIGGR